MNIFARAIRTIRVGQVAKARGILDALTAHLLNGRVAEKGYVG